jgi:hypothetical protein
MARTQEKSLFLHRHKKAWDHLVVEAANLRTREAEARQHAEEAEKMVSDLSERAHKDGEEVMEVVKEHDEMHRWDAEVRQ